MKRVTLQDIATIARVSRGTVDRVINNRGRVKPEVAARVKEIAAELGYSKNVHASQLARGELHALHLVLPDSELPYWRELRNSIQNYNLFLSALPLEISTTYFNTSDSSAFYLALQNTIIAKADIIVFVPFLYNESQLFMDQIDSDETKVYSLGIPFSHEELQASVCFSPSQFYKTLQSINSILFSENRNIALCLDEDDPLRTQQSLPSSITTISSLAEIPKKDSLLFLSKKREDLSELEDYRYILLDDTQPPEYSESNKPIGILNRNPQSQALTLIKIIIADMSQSTLAENGEVELPFYFL